MPPMYPPQQLGPPRPPTPNFALPPAPPLPPPQPPAPVMRTYDPPPQIPNIPMPDVSRIMQMGGMAPPRNFMEGIGHALRMTPMLMGDSDLIKAQNEQMKHHFEMEKLKYEMLNEAARLRDSNMLIYGDMNMKQSAAQNYQEQARRERSNVDIDRYEAPIKAQDTLAGASQKMAGAYRNTQQGNLAGARTETEDVLRTPRVDSEKAQAYQRYQSGNLSGERIETEQEMRPHKITTEKNRGDSFGALTKQRGAKAELDTKKKDALVTGPAGLKPKESFDKESDAKWYETEADKLDALLKEGADESGGALEDSERELMEAKAMQYRRLAQDYRQRLTGGNKGKGKKKPKAQGQSTGSWRDYY